MAAFAGKMAENQAFELRVYPINVSFTTTHPDEAVHYR
jgi:hypothetical protein